MKYLGIDYGTKRIGLAIGDDETNMAVVFGTVNDMDGLAQTIVDELIDVVVLGKPYSIVDATHALPEAFQQFVDALQRALPDGVTLVFEDERLSSKYADSLGGGKASASRDEIAAVSILQGYLDKHGRNV